MSDHAHDEEQYPSCPLPSAVKVLRMSEALSEAFEAFLAANLPDYVTVDTIAIMVETVEFDHEEFEEHVEKYYLVEHDSALEGGYTALNDPKEVDPDAP